ncbi:MAG: SpoIIE family protein phosphatase [SAR324 cluster bacterium]|nr:SpoIIE family protein phosphatase [SAR324 cluster bacterium]
MRKDPCQILVVDDDPMIHLRIRSAMKVEADCTVELLKASNGVEALKVLEAQNVSLLVTDLEMPEMDGFELIEQIRKITRYKDIPILFLTAHQEPVQKIRAFELGATDYIVKPFIIQEFRARVLGNLQRFQQQRLLQHELEQAREMQHALLEKELPEVPGMNVTVRYLTMSRIGGDFYDVFAVDETNFGFLIADVSGHGISAALISFMVSGIFKYFSPGLRSPKMVLDWVNGVMFNKLPEGSFASMFYGIYNPATQSFTYTSAAHPAALLIRPSTNEILHLKTRGLGIGMFSHETSHYEECKIDLLPKDKILLYTDGITEVFNEKEQMFGVLNLKHFLLRHADQRMEILLDQLVNHLRDFSGKDTFEDDVTLVGLEVV